MATGNWVWLPHEDLAWTPATIVANDGSYTRYRLPDSSEVRLANNVIDPSQLESVSSSSREGTTSNLVNLDEMGEGAVIHALRQRYHTDSIYTNIGQILVSINPYKLLPIYSSATIAKYPALPHPSPVRRRTSSRWPPAPTTQLMSQHEDQAVIISGESGAGKTEATKTVLSPTCRRSPAGARARGRRRPSVRDADADPALQPHPGVVRQLQDAAQQQLVALRQVHADPHQPPLGRNRQRQDLQLPAGEEPSDARDGERAQLPHLLPTADRP